MKSLRRPTAAMIRKFLAAQAKLDFTYTAVGATASLPPTGYVVDHTRIKLGEGEEVFTKAKDALRRWCEPTAHRLLRSVCHPPPHRPRECQPEPTPSTPARGRSLLLRLMGTSRANGARGR